MNIWLIKDSELVPNDSGKPRLARMGLIAEILLESGHQVTWWNTTFLHFKKEYRYHSDKSVLIKNNYRINFIHSCGYSKNVSLRRLLHNWIAAVKFYNMAKKTKALPDVIVVALPTISFVSKAIKYGRKRNIPVIVDVRDLNPDVFVDAFTGFKRSIVRVGIIPLQITLQRAMKKASAIFATTQPYLDFGLKYAKRKRKEEDGVYYVSYPDKDKTQYKEKVEYWINRLGCNGNLVVCFFGQFGSMSDIDTIIKAAKIIDENLYNVLFVLCGEGEKYKQYQEAVSKMKNVVMTGWVDEDDIQAIGQIADIGLMAYKDSKNYELQMPNKFCEYLSLGLAVFLQPMGIMQNVIKQNKCGLSYRSEKELVENIKYVLEQPNELTIMKRNARNLYEKNFCAESVYKAYADHIVEIGRD